MTTGLDWLDTLVVMAGWLLLAGWAVVTAAAIAITVTEWLEAQDRRNKIASARRQEQAAVDRFRDEWLDWVHHLPTSGGSR